MFKQIPIKGGREYASAAIDPKIMRWARRQAKRFQVSPSFVINTALSTVSKIPLEGDAYFEVDQREDQ
jgi:hypothetical protein